MEKPPVLKVINSVALVAIAVLLLLSYLKLSEVVNAVHGIDINAKYLADIFTKTPRQIEHLYQELTSIGTHEREADHRRWLKEQDKGADKQTNDLPPDFPPGYAPGMPDEKH